MTIDIEAFSLTQTVAENVDARLFEGMQSLYSREIVLTGLILRKNRLRHPEMDDKYHLLADACVKPDYVCRNRRDARIAVCYKVVGELRLRVALWLKQEDDATDVHNSVLSYRRCHEKELELEIKRGRVVYQRSSGDHQGLPKQHPYPAGPPIPCNPFDHRRGG